MSEDSTSLPTTISAQVAIIDSKPESFQQPVRSPTGRDDAAKGNSAASDSLRMAVPKRLLRRAVDRNAVKRVFREAWRRRKAEIGLAESWHLHLRLLARPASFAVASRLQRKRQWRLELDGLLQRISP